MHDLVIRGGTIVDGTGRPRFQGDIAVDGDRITCVGVVEAKGRREIDATGLLVAPGWVDMHTHYDGQVTWDPYVTPSGWHGVTTVVMGNCGVGFAPCRAEDRDWMIDVMEGVEDIPGSALSEGIQWDWETFPEYLDAIERRPLAVDVCTQIAHSAVRSYVMGQDSSEDDDASPEQIAQMKQLVEEALKAGALGFSTSRTPLHKSIMGKEVAGTHARIEELVAIGEALKSAGHGVFEVASEHERVPVETAWMRDIAKDTGRTVIFNLSQVWGEPNLWLEGLAKVEEAQAEGIPLLCQVAGRSIGILMNWQGTAHPFVPYDTYAATRALPWEEAKELLAKPETRESLLAGTPYDLGEFANFITQSYDKMYLFSESLDYEPDMTQSVKHVAEEKGVSPMEVVYDALQARNGNGFLYFPLFNYAGRNLDVLHTLHSHPHTRMGLSDGGAHCGAICDSGMPTFMVTHWTRDRTRGPKLDLEYIVHRQTQQTAELYGLNDRGVLKPGFKADINLIDYDSLSLDHPELINDLPAGGRRLVQRASGYVATIVSGQPIFEAGVATGVLPGQLVRGPQSAPASA